MVKTLEDNLQGFDVNKGNKRQNELPEGYVSCCFCGKTILEETSYRYTKDGGRYCDSSCFVLFTED